MAERRKDSKKRVLKEGEYQRSNGTYEYRWRSENGKRNNVYAKSLEELREKEAEIQRDRSDGIRSEARNATINDIHEQWLQLKKGLKANTLVNYEYMYKMYVFPEFGKRKVGSLKKSDVRRFYNGLVDSQRLKVATVENIHTVLHQVLDFAVEDEYLRINPSDNALKELKQTHNLDSERRKALTAGQQKLLMDFLKNSEKYNHWLPIITVMVECGLRAGEATGLRWEDINLDTGEISVNHTLIYYSHREKGCLYGINTPKTEAGNRIVPMTPEVKAAFVQEREYQPEQEAKQKEWLERRMQEKRHKNEVADVFESITRNSKKIQARKLFNYNIVLIGFMGAGKSTISDYLKTVFAMDIIEMDQIIAERAGMSISDIFETYGEQYFRDCETNLLIEMQSRTNVVISCGGGTPMRECNVVEMKKNGRVVLLTAKPETILDRVKDSHDRPLIENNKTVPFIADLMSKRREKYEAAADIIIETDGKSELEICEELIHSLRQMDAKAE